MKKYYFKEIILVGIIILFIYLQFGRQVRVSSTMSNNSYNNYELNLSIVANKVCILNKDVFAEQMIEKCKNNSFGNTLLSYDLSGYPNKVTIKVYANSLTEKYDMQCYTIVYETDNDIKNHYNIKDHSDKFKLRLEFE